MLKVNVSQVSREAHQPLQDASPESVPIRLGKSEQLTHQIKSLKNKTPISTLVLMHCLMH